MCVCVDVCVCACMCVTVLKQAMMLILLFLFFLRDCSAGGNLYANLNLNFVDSESLMIQDNIVSVSAFSKLSL